MLRGTIIFHDQICVDCLDEDKGDTLSVLETLGHPLRSWINHETILMRNNNSIKFHDSRLLDFDESSLAISPYTCGGMTHFHDQHCLTGLKDTFLVLAGLENAFLVLGTVGNTCHWIKHRMLSKFQSLACTSSLDILQQHEKALEKVCKLILMRKVAPTKVLEVPLCLEKEYEIVHGFERVTT